MEMNSPTEPKSNQFLAAWQNVGRAHTGFAHTNTEENEQEQT